MKKEKLQIGFSGGILFFVLFFFVQPLVSQIAQSIPYTIFETQLDTVSFNGNMSQIDFKAPPDSKTTSPKNIYWTKLDFSSVFPEKSQDDSKWILDIGYLNLAKIYFLNEGRLDSTILGSFELNKDFTGSFEFSRDQLLNDQFLLLKFSKLNNRQILGNKKFMLYPKEQHKFLKDYVHVAQSNIIALSYLLWGGVFVGIVISLIFYRTFKQREYIYYSLYALSLALFLGRFGIDWYANHIGNYSLVNFILNNAFELLAGMFYALFQKHFLGTTINYPILDKVIQGAVIIFIFWLLFDTAVIIFEKYTLHLVLLDIRAVLLSILVLFAILYLSINFKSNLNWFIIIGSLIYGTGSVLVYLTGNGNYLRLAAIGEITVFSLGLGYKVHLENKEKIKTEQEASMTYIKLLRSQLNPHFLFNAMNSIQHLVLSGNRTNALNYLGKFSKLMRFTLESSSQESILLSNEISFLKTYMDLEALRFDNGFEYSIEIDKEINPNTIEIPQMVSQPFVENAIIHGLIPKTNGPKNIWIYFNKKDNDIIECIIVDNGIGRAASQERKTNYTRHKSIGISLIKKRLDNLRKNSFNDSTVNFEDIHDSHGKPLGTKVTLTILVK